MSCSYHKIWWLNYLNLIKVCLFLTQTNGQLCYDWVSRRIFYKKRNLKDLLFVLVLVIVKFSVMWKKDKPKELTRITYFALFPQWSWQVRIGFVWEQQQAVNIFHFYHQPSTLLSFDSISSFCRLQIHFKSYIVISTQFQPLSITVTLHLVTFIIVVQ